MSSDKNALPQSDEPFLSRWARLKKEAAAEPPLRLEPAVEAAFEPPALPPVESLMPDSDFSVFMGSGVEPKLRQAALRKLFADPHFNVMDGLDIYIDDYTKPDPIAAEVIEQLAQFRSLGGVQRDGVEVAETQREQHVERQCAAAESTPDQVTDPGRGSAVDGAASELTPVTDKTSLTSAALHQDVIDHSSH